jgi:hypothetical protein
MEMNLRVPHPFRSLIAKWVGKHETLSAHASFVPSNIEWTPILFPVP